MGGFMKGTFVLSERYTVELEDFLSEFPHLRGWRTGPAFPEMVTFKSLVLRIHFFFNA